MIKKYLLLFLFMVTAIHGQNNEPLRQYFLRASETYTIPVEILLSLAASQTHFTHIVPIEEHADGVHQPPAYGIMALRDDDWFGHSLQEAATLINQPVSVVKNNVYYNILGAAAYLAKLAEGAGIDKSSIIAWKPILEKYSGIPQKDLQEFYSFEVYRVFHTGYSENGVTIAAHEDFSMEIFRDDVRGIKARESVESTDYPPAVWDPSPNFTTGSISQLFGVVHTTEGGFSGSLSWLKNPAAQASSHYIIRSSDGYMVQLVSESNKAWHARCWNGYMLGVEHEAYVGVASYYTDNMFIASAALFRHFAQKFGFGMNRNRIIGHNEWQNTTWKTWMAANYPGIDVTCNSHTDPGVYWDWDFYMQLVTQDTTRPAVVSKSPAANDTVSRASVISITFNQKMKKTETQSAFSISPAVAGAFTWTNNQRTLVFTPTTALAGGVTYQVTISTAAKNYLTLSPAAAVAFSFTTLTELAVTSVYPAANATGLHLLPQITVNFNSLVKPSSLSSNIVLQKTDNTIVPISAITYTVANGAGVAKFLPAQPLAEGTAYKITVKSTLLDTAGFTYGTNSIYNFTTGKEYVLSGVKFDSLETIGGWKDPNYSGSTVGTDSTSTFTLSNERVKSGNYSGKLVYKFTSASGGVCREYTSTKPNQGSATASRTGFWIYGDLSNNFLEYWFYYNSSANVILRVDTLDWLGWKFVETPIARITQAGDKLFHSIVIVQNPAGASNGVLYIDDGQRTDVSNFTVYCQAEGMYNPATNSWSSDSLTFALRQSAAPFTMVEQKTIKPDTTGKSVIPFTKAVIGTSYYLSAEHRNSIGVWSKEGRVLDVPVQEFDFKTTKANVFGENLKAIGGRMCLFSGDVNKDGFIDFTDLTLIDNDAYTFVTGYVVTDLNGDLFVDFSDLAIADNNAYNFAGIIIPTAPVKEDGEE